MVAEDNWVKHVRYCSDCTEDGPATGCAGGQRYYERASPVARAATFRSSTVQRDSHSDLDHAIRTRTVQGWRVESDTGARVTMVRGAKPNHILHLLISVFTLGIWLPVWAIISLTSKGQQRIVLTKESQG